jgi:multimeric flavodoxin WrbA
MSEVKLLGICGSARPRGNSRYLLEQALEGALSVGSVEAETYSIARKEYAPCDSCRRCAALGHCRIEDDFQELRDKWVAADSIIYSVPVYHMSIPGQLKCFIDRLGNSLRIGRGQTLKVIGSIAQGSDIFAGQEQALMYLNNHAMVMGCIPVRGDRWESYIGAAGWTENSTRKDAIKRLYDSGDLDAQAVVKACCSLGRRVAQIALIVKSGGQLQRHILEADGGYDLFLERIDS